MSDKINYMSVTLESLIVAFQVEWPLSVSAEVYSGRMLAVHLLVQQHSFYFDLSLLCKYLIVIYTNLSRL
jgi:hypothetical protein